MGRVVTSIGGGAYRMKSSIYFNEFLKCLHLFAQDIISKQELVFIVGDLLGRYPELTVSPLCCVTTTIPLLACATPTFR